MWTMWQTYQALWMTHGTLRYSLTATSTRGPGKNNEKHEWTILELKMWKTCRVLSENCEGQIQNGLSAPNDATNCTCISGCTSFVCKTTASAAKTPAYRHSHRTTQGCLSPFNTTHTHIYIYIHTHMFPSGKLTTCRWDHTYISIMGVSWMGVPQ